MVKPVFEARNKMRDADSAEDAYKIGMAFLNSDKVLTVKDGDAGTFARDIVKIFEEHEAPELLVSLLEHSKTGVLTMPSGLRHSLDAALTDFKAKTSYERELKAVLKANASILRTAKAASNAVSATDSFTKEAVGSPYSDISAARDTNSLVLAVNSVMTEHDIPDAEAKELLRIVTTAFRKLQVPADAQIEILNMIVDSSSEEDQLYSLALEKSVEIIKASEGPAPGSGADRRYDRN